MAAWRVSDDCGTRQRYTSSILPFFCLCFQFRKTKQIENLERLKVQEGLERSASARDSSVTSQAFRIECTSTEVHLVMTSHATFPLLILYL